MIGQRGETTADGAEAGDLGIEKHGVPARRACRGSKPADDPPDGLAIRIHPPRFVERGDQLQNRNTEGIGKHKGRSTVVRRTDSAREHRDVLFF